MQYHKELILENMCSMTEVYLSTPVLLLKYSYISMVSVNMNTVFEWTKYYTIYYNEMCIL